MSQQTIKTVALVDPLWIGHHPMYFSEFTASFLRVGARVIGLCPQPDAARTDILSLQPEAGDLVHHHLLPAGKRSILNGRFEGDPIRTYQRWRRASDVLADAEAATGWKADLVYFPYLDSYLRFLPFSAVPEMLLDRPWSGLYLRNHHHVPSSSPLNLLRMLAKGDALLRGGRCKSIGVLDERFIPAMEQYTGKQITAYPDVTQDGLPEQPYQPALEIQQKARGRKIIGIIGLERRKGFLTLLKTAALAREKNLPYYFVCAGTLPSGQFSDEEITMIQKTVSAIRDGEIDNLHLDPEAGRIREEADFNFLFSRFDIAWAAYEGFEGSSGTLSKAALFEIPCVASKGECVGDRVERYQIGETITEGSAEEALAAIVRLTANSENQPPARFAEYRENHSRSRLDSILTDLLSEV